MMRLYSALPWLRCPETEECMLTKPQAPENVRIVRPDGTEIPVAIAFDGTDEDGTNGFAVLDWFEHWLPGDELRWSPALPPKTKFVFPPMIVAAYKQERRHSGG